MNTDDSRTDLVEKIKVLDEDAVLSLVGERLQIGDDPLNIIEDAKEGMHQVGLLYEQEEYFISGLMLAGEIFQRVFRLVEPHILQETQSSAVDHILLGTVQGDIHDIGKNILKTMLQCHGFQVTDLGINNPPQRFVEQVLEIEPDIVGLSGLLTISYQKMKSTVGQIRQLPNAKLAQTPIIIGGGMVTAGVCASVGADYWAIDAKVGVDLCMEIMGEIHSVS